MYFVLVYLNQVSTCFTDESVNFVIKTYMNHGK